MLNEDQSQALDKIVSWLAECRSNPNADRFFMLEGSAGTGKTYCTGELTQIERGKSVFTAPTNKATRVLRQRLTRDDYKPDCRTTYSLLGLSLQANGEVRELTAPEEPVDLSSLRYLVVDEGSMVGTKLWPHIKQVSQLYNLPVLLQGDRYQIPPVKEKLSPSFACENRAVLEKVVRYDNQILRLVTTIRDALKAPIQRINVKSDNDGDEGVWKLEGLEFEGRFREMAAAGMLSKPDHAKAIAWRNTRVDELNRLARYAIYGQEFREPWLQGDRVVFTGPANDLEDKKIASTDDEGTVTSVAEGWHPLKPEYKVYEVSITLDTNEQVLARVLHPASQADYEREKARLGEMARMNGRHWKDFWGFQELFHQLRHSYALTAHRSQGSTYQIAMVDMNDMLLNRERYEAFQIFYVGASRAAKQLYIR